MADQQGTLQSIGAVLTTALRPLINAFSGVEPFKGFMLRLGWTYNILHQDVSAYRWFDLARRSSDPQIASEAGRAWLATGGRAG